MTLPEKTRHVARAWLEKASGDLETARAVVDDPRIPVWVAGFHLQQAVEKAWKGRLVLQGVRPAAVHDLRALVTATALSPRIRNRVLGQIEVRHAEG
jgi:HEPN domain-containing protein